MLQQYMSLSKRDSVSIISVSMGLNSKVHSSETAICMNKQGVVNLYVPLLWRAPFSVKLDKEKKNLFYNDNKQTLDWQLGCQFCVNFLTENLTDEGASLHGARCLLQSVFSVLFDVNLEVFKGFKKHQR